MARCILDNSTIESQPHPSRFNPCMLSPPPSSYRPAVWEWHQAHCRQCSPECYPRPERRCLDSHHRDAWPPCWKRTAVQPWEGLEFWQHLHHHPWNKRHGGQPKSIRTRSRCKEWDEWIKSILVRHTNIMSIPCSPCSVVGMHCRHGGSVGIPKCVCISEGCVIRSTC